MGSGHRKSCIGTIMVLAIAGVGLLSSGNIVPVRAASSPLPSGLNFGLGNGPGDLSWMTGSGVPWRYRYQYLSAGVNTGKGWETWNSPAGQFATYYMDDSHANGYLPVFSYYELLQSNPAVGTDESSRDYSNLNNASTMNAYYANFVLLMQKVQAFGLPVIVQIEPDLWGYLEQRAGANGPQSLIAMVNGSGYPDVAGLPDTAQGFGWALLKLRDKYAPNALLAIHASLWASGPDVATNTDPSLNVSQVADQTAAFLNAAGVATNPYGTTFDLVFNDVADHDAGWYGDTSHWWDKNNVTFPNFARWLAYMTRLHADTGKPLVVWQVPVGNQYFLTMNNTSGHYQDNRAEYFLAHPGDLAATGIQAVLFGKANAAQTNYTDDTGDGLTNNNGVPTSGYECNACNTNVSTVADDDGGYLRMAVGAYYSCPGHPASTSGTPPSGTTTTFYFAEGYTGPGFHETLSLFVPNQSGTATIDYYTQGGHLPTIFVPITAGRVAVEDVNADVGCNQQVSAKVTVPASGVVERNISFATGTWHGSTDVVGVNQPAVEWDFAEGSTLWMFSEYLSLQNPNAQAVTVDLNYATDSGAHPAKTLTIPAATRLTVAVNQGDLTSSSACQPLTTCGVGGGIVGVSVQVKSRSLPIMVERPMYVNGYSFGSGLIRDGHDDFGTNAPATAWNFAEGTTLAGFYEYATLQNPGSTAAHVSIRYLYDLGTHSVTITLAAHSRQTVLVFDQAHWGVGPGYVGVSMQVNADQPIVAERPMYIVHDFGSGSVAGAHVVAGVRQFATLTGFASASTLAGDNDYLTVQNPNATMANLTISYYTSTGVITRALAVPATSRHTVLVFQTNEGVGSGIAPVGIVVASDQPVLVEKPTYSSNSPSYGATDTVGYSPASF